MHFLSVLTTLLVTASVTVAVPGSNAAQASCQSRFKPCINGTAAHPIDPKGGSCCPWLTCNATGVCID